MAGAAACSNSFQPLETPHIISYSTTATMPSTFHPLEGAVTVYNKDKLNFHAFRQLFTVGSHILPFATEFLCSSTIHKRTPDADAPFS
jgi:hypothetical protein